MLKFVSSHPLCLQILSITCDNASPNDVMIDELAGLIKSFPGDANHTRCFNHILSLVAKSIIRQFDLLKAEADEALSVVEKELFDIAEGIDLEEESMAAADQGVDDEENNDNIDGWVDERKTMSREERIKLDQSVLPVRLVLVKVRTKNDITHTNSPDLNMMAYSFASFCSLSRTQQP